MPERRSEEWFQQLRDQLTEVAERLLDAARYADDAGPLRAEIDRQLAAIEELLATIDQHLGRAPPDRAPDDGKWQSLRGTAGPPDQDDD